MKKNKVNVVEEVVEIEETIEETVDETVEEKADLPAEVKKENFVVRGFKAVVSGGKKHGKKVLVGAGLAILSGLAGAAYAKNKYSSDGAGNDVNYNGDDGYEVIDLEPDDYTEETSYEESNEE